MTELKKGSFLSTKELSEILCVSKTTVTKWCRDGTAPGMKVAGHWRIPANWSELKRLEECYERQK